MSNTVRVNLPKGTWVNVSAGQSIGMVTNGSHRSVLYRQNDSTNPPLDSDETGHILHPQNAIYFNITPTQNIWFKAQHDLSFIILTLGLGLVKDLSFNDDFNFKVSAGLVPGYSSIIKSGHNPSVSFSAEEDIWAFGGKYPWPTTAARVTLLSDSILDDNGNLGAWSCIIEGLDTNLNPITEILECNGVVGTLSTAYFFRINSFRVYRVGTYGGTNVGNLQLVAELTLDVLGYILAGEGADESTMFTIPAGKRGYLLCDTFLIESGKAVDLNLRQRDNADVVTSPFFPAYNSDHFEAMDSPLHKPNSLYREFDEKADIWFTGQTTGANPASVSVLYCIILRDK